VPRADADSVRCRLCGERYRLITPTHLWSRHRWRDDHPALAYKERFGVATVWSRASRRAMSRSVRTHYDRKGRKWTTERLLAALRRLRRDGRALRFSAVSSARPELYWTAQRLFGSWKAACRAAGLPRSEWDLWPEWTRERVILAIRERHRSRSPLHWKGVWDGEKSLYWAAQRYLGSWRSALRAANVPPEAGCAPTRWSAERVVRAVRARFRSGKAVTFSAVRRDDFALYKAALRHVGSWRAALLRARIPEAARTAPR
jgi:hypothetical protein